LELIAKLRVKSGSPFRRQACFVRYKENQCFSN